MNHPDALFDPGQLVDEYFLRDFSEEEIDALNAALATDDALKRQFIESMNDDLDLYEAFQQVEEEKTLRKKIVIHRAPKKKIVVRPRQPRQQKRKSPVLKMAASLLLFLGAGLAAYWVVNQPAPTPVVSAKTYQTLAKVTDLYALAGDPISAVHTGQTRALQLGDYLKEGEQIFVPIGGRLAVTYLADFTTISFDPESSFRLLTSGGANGLELSQGCLMAEVTEQQPGQSFRLMTDDAEIVVLGTRFELRNEGATRVSVASGNIRMNALSEDESVSVTAGYFVESDQGAFSAPAEFYWEELNPLSSATLPKARRKDAIDRFITVDPGRNLKGRLDFKIPPVGGRISEAVLKLRVASFESESGGEGTVRVKKVDRKTGLIGERVFRDAPEIASYTGRAADGMDLLLKLDPSLLTVGDNHFLLGMDEGGDDFWFGAQENPHPPELRLTIVK